MAQCEHPVKHDGTDDERANHGALPEVGHAKNRQRPVDGEKELFADGRTPHRSAATKDCYAADDGRTNRIQLDAATGL